MDGGKSLQDELTVNGEHIPLATMITRGAERTDVVVPQVQLHVQCQHPPWAPGHVLGNPLPIQLSDNSL